MFYEIDTKWEDNKLGLLIKDEEKKIEEEDKKIKKKKKTKKIKNVDIYMMVLDEIINAKNILIEKKGKNKMNKYYYPILKTHKIIERNEEERRQRILEEKMKEMDKIRFENERRTLKEEDINIYKGEDDPKSNSEEESSEYD
jgi:F0F1-type ATP synthase alpha subunit